MASLPLVLQKRLVWVSQPQDSVPLVLQEQLKS